MKTKPRSVELRAELEKINARIDELTPERDMLTAKLAEATSAFANKTIDFESLLDVKTRLALVSESLDALTLHRQQLEDDLEAVLVIEQHDNVLNELVRLAATQRKNVDKSAEAQKRFSEAADALFATSDALDQTRASVFANLRKLVAGVEERGGRLFVPKESRAAYDATVEALERAGLSRADLDFATAGHHAYPKTNHAALIESAFQYRSRQRGFEEQQRREDARDRADAERAKQQEAAQRAQRELAMEQQNQTYDEIIQKLDAEERKAA